MGRVDHAAEHGSDWLLHTLTHALQNRAQAKFVTEESYRNTIASRMATIDLLCSCSGPLAETAANIHRRGTSADRWSNRAYYDFDVVSWGHDST